jgi:CRP-like cAMP-binding protein/membrane protease YdiL (CAAX protease family)
MEKLIGPDQQTWKSIRAHPIFMGIDDDDITNILPYFRLVVSKKDEIFLEEGLDGSTDLYLILDGKLEVLKKADTDSPFLDNRKTKHFVIAQLNTGDAIGELSFIKGEPRSASIKSVTNSVLLSLNPSALSRLESDYPATSTRMMKNMVGYVGDRLKRTSENEVRALRTELQNSILKSKANLFFSYVIGLLCVYNLTLHTTSNFSRDVNQATLVSTLIVIIFSGVLYLMTRQSRLPLSQYGLTTKNWRPALNESLRWSGFIILLMILAKWFLIENVTRYQNLPLFDFDPTKEGVAFNFILYGLHCPVQEFIARGVLQGSLQRFFSGKNVTARAILVSNALFSATHIHIMGGLLGIIVFVPGLFWGWLYSKHDNLLGVSISHVLIGWTGLFFLDLESLF